MPPLAPPLVSLLHALLPAIFVAMLLSWGWALRQIYAGRPLLPPTKSADTPWGTGAVIILFVTYLMVQVLTLQGYLLLTRRPPSVPLSFREQMILTSLINGILLVVIPLALHGISGALPEHLGLTWKRIGWQVWVGFVAFLIVALPVNAINFFSVRVWTPHEHPMEKMVREEGAGAISLGELAGLAFLTAVVLAPAAEELIFRGVIQNWLSRVFRRWANQGVLTPPETTPAEELDFIDPPTVYVPPTPIPPKRPIHQFAGDGHPPNPCESPQARLTDRRGWEHDPTTRLRLAEIMPVVLTSVLFAAAHAPQWPAPIAIFVLSLALGAVYQRTRSLVASFVLHALFNGLSTLVLFLMLLGGHLPAPRAAPPQAYVEISAGGLGHPGVKTSSLISLVPKIWH